MVLSFVSRGDLKSMRVPCLIKYWHFKLVKGHAMHQVLSREDADLILRLILEAGLGLGLALGLGSRLRLR